MAKAITINGADPAAAVQKLLNTVKRGGVGEQTLHHADGVLRLEDAFGSTRAVVVQNDSPGVWRGLVTEFRRLGGMKAEPSGRATYQQGTVRNNNPKRGQVMGEALFTLKMNRLIKKELPSRVTMIPA
jgi:hypothetical protein